MKRLLRRYGRSLNFKITVISVLTIIAGIAVVTIFINNRVDRLAAKTLRDINGELNKLVEEYYDHYTTEITLRIERELDMYMDELMILTDIFQTVFDQAEDMEDLTALLKEHPEFQDELAYNGSWYQNHPDEQTVVYLGRHLLDEEQNIQASVQEDIDRTLVFDLIMPSFAKYGTEKIQLYYTGGEDSDFTRMAPWVDIGNSMYDVYPELSEMPMWPVFYPGLIEDWTALKKTIDGENLTKKNMIRVSQPTQDGITDEIVMSLSSPVWDAADGQFRGHIAYDVPINHIIDEVEAIKISETGFAMLIQSNGNVLAVNEAGAETIGLYNNKRSTVNDGVGFNRLERFLKDSRHEAVRNIDLNGDQDLKELTIEGEDYVFFSKKMNPYLTWAEGEGFKNESWTLGFIVPKDEIYKMYFKNETMITEETDIIANQLLVISSMIVLMGILTIITYNKKVTGQLNRLTHQVKGIKEKNYEVDFDIDSDDEIGKLSLAFSDMQEEIHHTIQQLNVQNEVLKNEIDERIKKDRMIDYLENFDAQTDLLNKQALLNRMRELSAETDDGYVSLIAIRLNELRELNNIYSFKVANTLIMGIAQRLKGVVAEDQFLFRIAGDEFAVLFKGEDINDLIVESNEIESAFEHPFSIGDKSIKIDATLGISTYPFDTQQSMDLLQYATIALNHAKATGKFGCEFYNDEMNVTFRSRLDMIQELSTAIEKDEFELHYQPIINAKTNEINGVEALLRWYSSKLGNVRPDIFIPIAEGSDQIIRIGSWVLRESFKTLNELTDMGYDNLEMAINISVVQFMKHDLVSETKALIEETGVDPNRVIFEVTEGLFINDIHKVKNCLEQLRKLGIKISIDDFGTGYSSLSYLKNLPINKLKIDKTFISEINDKTGWAITNATIALANGLNLMVVAEGVENEEQLAHLREKHCYEAQGYYFSKPLPLEALVEKLSLM